MRKKVLVMALICGLILSGCAGTGKQPAPDCAPKEDDRLVIYTAHKKEVWWPIVKEFEERTGIWVDVVSGGTNELLERISEERDEPRADVMFGGGVESLEFYRDCFEPYVCEGAGEIQAQFRAPDDLWTPFSSLPVVLIYNTKLVGAQWLNGWDDLLAPKFHGKIAFADPGISGSSFTGLVTMLYALGGDREETLRHFASNLKGGQLDSSGAVVSSVAEGSDWVGVTLEETALKHMAAGEDIALVYPADGTSSVPDGSALVKGAPHGENARLFLDFTVSLDVQQLMEDQFYRRSVRTDVESGEKLIDLGKIPLVDYDVGWASGNRESVLMSWAFYLGGEEEP